MNECKITVDVMDYVEILRKTNDPELLFNAYCLEKLNGDHYMSALSDYLKLVEEIAELTDNNYVIYNDGTEIGVSDY